MDFRWFRFVGRKKLGYTNKETMRLTLREFNKEYQIYKDDFDLELLLRLTRTTYEQAKRKARQSDEWF